LALTFFETNRLPNKFVIELMPPLPVLGLLALRLPGTVSVNVCPGFCAHGVDEPINNVMLRPLPPLSAAVSFMLPGMHSAALGLVACPASRVTDPPLPKMPLGLTTIADGLTVRLPGATTVTLPPLPAKLPMEPPVALNEICFDPLPTTMSVVE